MRYPQLKRNGTDEKFQFCRLPFAVNVMLILSVKAWVLLAMQAQAQARHFLFHHVNGLDACISTSTSPRIKLFLFLVLALIFIMLVLALQQVKTKYRSGMTQAQRIFTTHGCVWALKTLNSLECSDDFACAYVCVELRFHLGHPYSFIGLCLRC